MTLPTPLLNKVILSQQFRELSHTDFSDYLEVTLAMIDANNQTALRDYQNLLHSFEEYRQACFMQDPNLQDIKRHLESFVQQAEKLQTPLQQGISILMHPTVRDLISTVSPIACLVIFVTLLIVKITSVLNGLTKQDNSTDRRSFLSKLFTLSPKEKVVAFGLPECTAAHFKGQLIKPGKEIEMKVFKPVAARP